MWLRNMIFYNILKWKIYVTFHWSKPCYRHYIEQKSTYNALYWRKSTNMIHPHRAGSHMVSLIYFNISQPISINPTHNLLTNKITNSLIPKIQYRHQNPLKCIFILSSLPPSYIFQSKVWFVTQIYNAFLWEALLLGPTIFQRNGDSVLPSSIL